MLSTLSAQLEKWPPHLLAGVLFLVFWIPIVLIAAAGVWLKQRARLVPPIAGDRSDWTRAVVLLLALGFPLALGFGLLFALQSVVVLIATFVVICIVLVGFLLPRLMRW